jgi:hypothetical protein
MTPERHFALKLKAHQERANIDAAKRRLKELFDATPDRPLCAIELKHNGPNSARFIWRDENGGEWVGEIACCHRSMYGVYIETLLAEQKRLRADRKAREKGAAA